MKRRELSRPARTLVVLVWAMTAVLAGTVTSRAVSVIGSEEGVAKARVLSEADVAAALQQQVAAPAASASPTATPAETPTATPTPDVPSESPSATAKPTHRATPTPTPTTTPAQTLSPSSATVERIFNVTGGQVDAFCTGAAFTMYAAPLDGWSVEIDHNGPGSGEVTFRKSGSESKLTATCQDGVPTKASDGGGGD
jgi:hypothetical protein